jgi:predicted AAA+ superfamily ATPase
MYVPRDALPTLDRLGRGFPVLLITGPRQSGKSTLARHYRPDLPYVSMENPADRQLAVEDPRGFFDRLADGAIIDEVQAVPELLSWLQGIVDDDPRMGRFILTGSQQPELARQVTQSLAGRVARVELLPLSGTELTAANLLASDLTTALWTGGYPAIYDRGVDPSDWLPNYVATYLERDVRALLEVRNRTAFTQFLRACAGRSAQLLNVQGLGSDVGVSGPTARSWISVLEATYIASLVEPWSLNVTTRMVKAPELVFLDSGLLTWLIGISEPAQLDTHPLRGAVFESWGISEVIKAVLNQGRRTSIGFLRDKNGTEVDLVMEHQGSLVPIEFKAGRTYASDWSSSINRWRERSSSTNWGEPMIVYGGDDSVRRSGVWLRSWHDFAADPLGVRDGLG